MKCAVQYYFFSGKNGMVASPGGILNAFSPREISAKTGWPMPNRGLSGEIGGEEGFVDMFKAFKESLNHHPRSQSDVSMQPAYNHYGLTGNKIVTNTASTESTLFSSSLSEIFPQKCKILFHVC